MGLGGIWAFKRRFYRPFGVEGLRLFFGIALSFWLPLATSGLQAESCSTMMANLGKKELQKVGKWTSAHKFEFSQTVFGGNPFFLKRVVAEAASESWIPRFLSGLVSATAPVRETTDLQQTEKFLNLWNQLDGSDSESLRDLFKDYFSQESPFFIGLPLKAKNFVITLESNSSNKKPHSITKKFMEKWFQKIWKEGNSFSPSVTEQPDYFLGFQILKSAQEYIATELRADINDFSSNFLHKHPIYEWKTIDKKKQVKIYFLERYPDPDSSKWVHVEVAMPLHSPEHVTINGEVLHWAGRVGSYRVGLVMLRRDFATNPVVLQSGEAETIGEAKLKLLEHLTKDFFSR